MQFPATADTLGQESTAASSRELVLVVLKREREAIPIEAYAIVECEQRRYPHVNLTNLREYPHVNLNVICNDYKLAIF